MVVLFASATALSCGAADFYGGLATRRNSALTVVGWAQFTSLFIILVAAPLTGAARIIPADLLWTMIAGTCGLMGTLVLYKGLAEGQVSIVSPTAALSGAVLPVLFGILAEGETPSPLSGLGILIALPAILLLSFEKGEHRSRVLPSLAYGLLAGLGFSGFFILIARASQSSGLWPLLTSRCLTVPLLFAVVLPLSRQPRTPVKGSRLPIFLSGALDMAGNIFYLLACQSGQMVTAVILTSLYPAPTVLLQRFFLKERLNPGRIGGLILAMAGAALIGIGG